MSTLGKIVAVFIVLVSVALAAMLVTFVQNTPDWRATALQQKEALRKAEQNIGVLEDAVRARNDELAEASRMNKSQVQQQKSRIDELQENITQLQGQISQITNSRQALETELSGLNETLAKIQSEKTRGQEQYQSALAKVKEAEGDAQALAEEKFDLQRTVAELERKTRLYEQQIVEQEKKLNYLTQVAGDVPQARELPTTDLNGRVRAADNQQMVAEISLGANDGVTEGLTFLVSRDGQYLGDLVVTQVDENSAVGQLKTVQGQIQEGDRVTYDYRQ